MADDRVSNWVELQKKVWSCDDGLRAELITLETPGGDIVASWPVDLENLGAVINQTIDMQSAELPKGQHRFRLAAYSDKARKNQLNELPQTIRGRSGEASQANADAIALQRATAMAITNFERVCDTLTRMNEKLETRLDERTEDFAQVYNKLIEANADNFDQKIRWSEHEAKTRRNEQLLEMCEPLIGMAVQRFGPMLLKMNPDDVKHFFEKPAPLPSASNEDLKAALARIAELEARLSNQPLQPEVVAPSQGVDNAGTSEEPASTASAAVHEPGPQSVSSEPERGPQGTRSDRAAVSGGKASRATNSSKGKRRR